MVRFRNEGIVLFAFRFIILLFHQKGISAYLPEEIILLFWKKAHYSTSKGRFFHLVFEKVSYSTFPYWFIYSLIQRFSSAPAELCSIPFRWWRYIIIPTAFDFSTFPSARVFRSSFKSWLNFFLCKERFILLLLRWKGFSFYVERLILVPFD